MSKIEITLIKNTAVKEKELEEAEKAETMLKGGVYISYLKFHRGYPAILYIF